MTPTLADHEELLSILNQAAEKLAIGLEFAGRSGIHIPELVAVAQSLSSILGAQAEQVIRIRGSEPPN